MRPGQSRRRLRVTTGCLTCRARRVKCDERRPICRNCGKKNRRCLYHGGPGETSTNDQTEEVAQPPSSTNRAPRRVETTRPLIETVSRALGSSSDTRVTRHPPPSVGKLTESIYTTTTTPSEPELVDHDSPTNRTQPLESTPAPNLYAILQHTNFPGPSHPLSPTSSPAQPLPQHHHPFEEPSHHDHPIQRAFYVADPIQLSFAEIHIFRNYVERVSKWIDSFSHDQPFYNQVPSLALHCPMLLYACLAASAKQLSRAPQSTTSLTLDTSPVLYYQQALREMSHFLIEPSYSGSDELLASSIILSTYEILDVSGPSFGSHLKGVASLIRSHRITGDETGIRGATYWTWYRHEVWVAFQTGRRMFLDEEYWRPKDVEDGLGFEGISMRDVANRVLFVFGQCVSWYGGLCAGGSGSGRDLDTSSSTGVTGIDMQQEEVERQCDLANELRGALEEWKRKLPVSMRINFRQTQPQSEREDDSTVSVVQEIHQFPAIWYAYPESAISHQLYHASKILLGLYTPSSSSSSANSNPLHTRRELEKSRREIFMIANSRIDQTWGLISTQCLYVAGLVTEGILERERTLELIEMCQRVTGRQTVCIADQLRGFWKEEEE